MYVSKRSSLRIRPPTSSATETSPPSGGAVAIADDPSKRLVTSRFLASGLVLTEERAMVTTQLYVVSISEETTPELIRGH